MVSIHIEYMDNDNRLVHVRSSLHEPVYTTLLRNLHQEIFECIPRGQEIHDDQEGRWYTIELPLYANSGQIGDFVTRLLEYSRKNNPPPEARRPSLLR